MVRGLWVATKLVHKDDSTAYLPPSKLLDGNLFQSIVCKAHTYSTNPVYAASNIGNDGSSLCDEKPFLSGETLVRGLWVATKLVHKDDSTAYLPPSKLLDGNLFQSIVCKAHTYSTNPVYAASNIGNDGSSLCDEKPFLSGETRSRSNPSAP